MNEILIYDFIGADMFGEGVTAKGVKSQLDSMSGDVLVRINSLGGDVFDGFAIHNLLKQYPGEITVKIDGVAASAASIIAMAGDQVEIADNAMIMIHNPWTFAVGDADTMLKSAELLEKVKGSIITSYEAKTGIDSETLAAAMDAETWYTAPEAIEQGFADSVLDESASAFNTAAPWVKNAPAQQIEPESPDYRIAARARFPAL